MSRNIEMNYFNGNGYEVLYPNTLSSLITLQDSITTGTINDGFVYLNNLITSLSSSIGNGNIQTGSTRFTDSGGTLQVPIKNPRVLFFGCPPIYNQFYLFICVYPFTRPVCIYYSSDRDGSFTNTGTYCSWSSTRVTFSISWGLSGTWSYLCESIK